MIHKVLALGIGVVLALVLVEIGMRTLGERILAAQESRNEILPKDAQSIRILTLGESTTADFYGEESRETVQAWPRQLEVKLAEQGAGVRVYNLGRTATTTSGILSRLPEQLDQYRPQIVISMMGINDSVSFLNENAPWWKQLRVVKLSRRIWSGGGSVDEAEKGESTTIKNYRALNKILSDRKIIHIAMQYPTRSIDSLKNYFKDPGESEFQIKNIYFVENKTNFAAALAKHSYDDIFSDHFAESFGHTTTLGHGLIADALVPVVVEAIKSRFISNFPPEGDINIAQ